MCSLGFFWLVYSAAPPALYEAQRVITFNFIGGKGPSVFLFVFSAMSLRCASLFMDGIAPHGRGA